MKTNKRAFTLIEILLVAAIMLVLMSIALDGLPEQIVKWNIEAEDKYLDELKRDIERSFESEDFATYNIASLTGEVPTGTLLTAFSTSTAPIYATTATNDWFAKLARVRGFGVTTAAPTKAAQPALASLLTNKYDRTRLLLVAPAEADKQRFLLVSLMSSAEQLALPPFDPSQAFFDSIWNTEWNTRTANIPAYWASRLTADQVASWNGTGTGSRLYRLRVIRITLPRYQLNISNGHAAHNAYFYTNGAANGTPSYVRGANTGSAVWPTPGLLGGRVVRVRVGTDEATATEKRRIQMRQNNDVIVQ